MNSQKMMFLSCKFQKLVSRTWSSFSEALIAKNITRGGKIVEYVEKYDLELDVPQDEQLDYCTIDMN